MYQYPAQQLLDTSFKQSESHEFASQTLGAPEGSHQHLLPGSPKQRLLTGNVVVLVLASDFWGNQLRETHISISP